MLGYRNEEMIQVETIHRYPDTSRLPDSMGEERHRKKASNDGGENRSDCEQNPPRLQPCRSERRELRENVYNVRGAVEKVRQHREDEKNQNSVDRNDPDRPGQRSAKIADDNERQNTIIDEAPPFPISKCVCCNVTECRLGGQG